MGMNGSYGSHCGQLMKQDRYKKYIEDADSKKVYYDGIQKNTMMLRENITGM